MSIPLDDLQLWKNTTKDMAAYLGILYRAMIDEGLPDDLTQQITFSQWNILTHDDPLSTMIKYMNTPTEDDDADD